MLSRDDIIEKVKLMPDDLLKEIGDFIGFLESKRRQEEIYFQVREDESSLMESDMNNYLSELVAYEDMLAQGVIQWR